MTSPNTVDKKPSHQDRRVSQTTTTSRTGELSGIWRRKVPSALAKESSRLSSIHVASPKSLARPASTLFPQSTTSVTFSVDQKGEDDDWFHPWRWLSWFLTAWAPSFMLDSCFGIKSSDFVRQAWREKMSICILIILISGLFVFLVFGANMIMCSNSPSYNQYWTWIANSSTGQVFIHGQVYDTHKLTANGSTFIKAHNLMARENKAMDNVWVQNKTAGADLSMLFPKTDNSACAAFPSENMNVSIPNLPFQFAFLHNTIKGGKVDQLLDWMSLGPAYFSWNDVRTTTVASSLDMFRNQLSQTDFQNLYFKVNLSLIRDPTDLYNLSIPLSSPVFLVYKSRVLNLWPFYYDMADKKWGLNASTRKLLLDNLGQDATLSFTQESMDPSVLNCLLDRYTAGRLDTDYSCVASTGLTVFSLMLIVILVLIKFISAIIFSWSMSNRLDKVVKQEEAKRHAHILRTEMAISSRKSGFRRNHSIYGKSGLLRKKHSMDYDSPTGLPEEEFPPGVKLKFGNSSSPTTIAQDMHLIFFMPVYCEDRACIKQTLDSLAQTTYNPARKLVIIVADGIVKGTKESISTPAILKDLIDLDSNWSALCEPQIYESVGSGSESTNRAQIYVGLYNCPGSAPLPTILIIKCGNGSERSDKPGNRGKRDSQTLLMRFLQRVTFNQPMSELEFDLFTKIRYLTGVTPDAYECLLSVDTDTVVKPDSISLMVAAMVHDARVIGLCGETKIANKNESLVTMIQVYDYFISHQLTKSFESLFGKVTCLPGCFNMIRIKAQGADGYWVPILANPDIVKLYSETETDTLHKKNLLLLGEDRFLSTILLKTFPNRTLIYVPKAYCRTTVPATFSILLSQRRRWINSTIHNLMELVLIRKMCGVFCFSMQFVIFLELLGTLVLPAGTLVLVALIIFISMGPSSPYQVPFLFNIPFTPILFFLFTLFMPAFLIFLAKERRPSYLFYFFIYVLALIPVWNFIMPLYSFVKMDDFSWGSTRQAKGDDVGTTLLVNSSSANPSLKEGENGNETSSAISVVPLESWDVRERRRLAGKNAMDIDSMTEARMEFEAEQIKKVQEEVQVPPQSDVFIPEGEGRSGWVDMRWEDM